MSNEIEYKMADVEVPILGDTAPDLLQKLYVYELPNTKTGRAFLKENATSLVYVGNYSILEAVLSTVIDGELVPTNQFTNFSEELKNVSSIEFQTNTWLATDAPQLVVVGEPLDIDRYDKGEQEIFYIINKVVVKEANPDQGIIHQEGEYTATLSNFNNLLRGSDGSRLLLHRYPNLGKDVDKIGISTQNQALLHSIFAKGEITSGTEIRFSDIDLVSEKPLAPMRIQVAYIEDKVVLDFPWLDYDSALPLFAARIFTTSATLDTYIKNEDDRKFVEDVLFYSYMYANEFKDVPTITDPAAKNYGELDPAYKMGHKEVQAAKIWSQNPTNVIDKLLVAHKQDHPPFASSRSRYQPVYQIINALSQYVFSSMATKGGNNSMHMALLPWYLEISGEKGLAPSVDTTNKIIKPNTTTTFISKSVYFNDAFGSGIAEHGQTNLKLIDHLKMANMKTVQADKKILLEVMPDTLAENTISLSPLDQTSDDMGYIVYLPLSEDQWSKLMLGSPDDVSNTQSSSQQNVIVPDDVPGHKKTVAEKEGVIRGIYNGATIVNPPQPTKKTQASTLTFGTYGWRDAFTGSYFGTTEDWKKNLFERYNAGVNKDGLRFKPEQELVQILAAGLNLQADSIEFAETPSMKVDSGSDDDLYTPNPLKLLLVYNVWTDALVSIPAGSGGKVFGVNGRETRFDKQEWKELLLDYGFIPAQEVLNTYSERKGWHISRIEELNIKSLNQDDFNLTFYPNNEQIRVGSITNDNEQIASNIFIFT